MLNARDYVRQVKQYFSRHPTRLFPCIISVILIALTVAGISGTSIGTLYPSLYGTQKNPDLIIGNPQPIRSDEFLVNTQLTVVQSNSNFPRVNETINNGRDMSIVVDVPYWDWSMFLKPQNLPFFVMPLENAFAMKWWLLLALLLISVYYLSLRITKGSIIPSVLISIAFSCSPFIWWWYQTGTNATLYYGVFILLLVMNIVDRRSLKILGREISGKRLQFIYALSLAYLLACFAVILYPPFQIPVALVIAIASLGYLLQKRNQVNFRELLFTVGVSVVIAFTVVGAFVLTRLEPIQAVSSTVYPGQRLSGSGNYDILRLFSTNLQFQLQRDGKANHYYSNESESSSFIVIPLILLLPSIYLLIHSWRNSGKFDWLLGSLVATGILFTIHLLVEGFSPFNRIFLLQYSPPLRAIIGYGLLGALLLMCIVRHISSLKLDKRHVSYASMYTLIATGVCISAGFLTSQQYPLFISNPLLLVGSGLILYSAYLLVFLNKVVIGLSILAVFSIASISNVHPLYRGLSPLTDTRVADAVNKVDPNKDDGEIWGYGGVIYFENLPQISLRNAVTGVNFYPNTKFWELYASTPEQALIYNRYAHVQLSDSSDELKLVQPDLFTVSNRCDKDIMQEIDYVLSTEKISSTCVKLARTVEYPATTFYIYRVTD